MRSAVYRGVVAHARQGPTPHAFRHRACMYLVDLDEAEGLDARLRLFAFDRRGPVSLLSRDHFGDTSRGLRANVEEHLRGEGIDLRGGRILLLTNLRVLGYVFNPISVFWCHHRDGDLAAVVAEVSNTFGERHLYTLPAGAGRTDGRHRVWEVPKRMHVSPFYDTSGVYRFSLTDPGPGIHLAISYVRDGERPFHASFTGRRAPFTDRSLALLQLRHPLMPQRVTGLIHLEALRLWRKRTPVHRKPAFRPGEGSLPAPAGASPPARRGLTPPPPARLSPATPLVRALTPWALSRPPVGSLELVTPDGRTHRASSTTPGPSARVTVNSRDLYRRFATRGMTGVGESYVAGDWDADDLPAALELMLRTSQARRSDRIGRLSTRLRDLRPRLPERVSMALAGRHIRYHYDLGNDLYELFLDDTLTYSCAVFTRPAMTLEEAQREKHRRICDKLGLTPDDHLLEIGCGWGAFAITAAGEYGCRVTGVTLSREQHAEATRRVREAGLQDRVTLLLQDYRTLSGRYSHIASTEMIEAIGHRELPTFFRTCDRLLEDDGIACIQVIAMPDQRYDRYRRSRDWISQYVFPGATCPSLSAMLDAMRTSSELIVHGVEDIGIHYAETLRRWRMRFEANRERVLALGFDETFIRGWEFYLASCEAAFRCRSIHDYQLVLTRPLNDRLPGVPGVDAPGWERPVEDEPIGRVGGD